MRAEQRIRGGGTGRIRPVGNEAGVMGSTPNPFEIKGILDTRLSRELPWKDVLCVEKWWRRRESNPRPQALLPKELYMLSRARFSTIRRRAGLNRCCDQLTLNS